MRDKRKEDDSRVKMQEPWQLRQKTESRGRRTHYKSMLRRMLAVYTKSERVYCTFARSK